MKKSAKLLQTFADSPGRVFAVWTLLLAGAALVLSGLKVDGNIANLLSKDDPYRVALEEFSDLAGAETAFDIALKGRDFEHIRAFGDVFVSKSLSLTDPETGLRFFSKANFHNSTKALEDNFLYFLTPREYEELITWMQSELDRAKKEANPFFTELFEEGLDSVPGPPAILTDFKARVDLPDEYQLSRDSTVLVIQLIPQGAKSDLKYMERVVQALNELKQEMAAKPGFETVEVVYGSRLFANNEIVDALQRQLNRSVFLSVSLIVVFIAVYLRFLLRGLVFRGKHPALVKAFPVLVLILPTLSSIVFTYVAALFIFGEINLLTTALIGILFGMNIDYSLHLFSAYIDLRKTQQHQTALLNAYEESGRPLFWSCVTTGLALLSLIVSGFKGFYEFGVLAAIGIGLNFVSTALLSAPLFTLFDRIGKLESREKPGDFEFSERRTSWIPIFSGIVGVITVWSLFAVPKVAFEYDFGKLEPPRRSSTRFQIVTADIKTGRWDPAFFVFQTPEETEEMLENVLTKKDGKFLMVDFVESLPARIAYNESSLARKEESVQRVRKLLEDPFLRDQKGEELDRIRKSAASGAPVPYDSLPDVLKNRIQSKDGTPLPLVVLYAKGGLGDGRTSIAYKNDAGSVKLASGRTVYAASTQMVAASVLEQMIAEFELLMIIPLAVSFFTILFHVRSLAWALAAFLPLLAGISMMLGAMVFAGVTFNLFNLIVLPIILGVGDDTGIHLVHKFRSGGFVSVSSLLRSTFLYVSASSLTTVLGFSGLLLLDHPGLFSMGFVATTGVCAVLLASLASVPVMMFLKNRETGSLI